MRTPRKGSAAPLLKHARNCDTRIPRQYSFVRRDIAINAFRHLMSRNFRGFTPHNRAMGRFMEVFARSILPKKRIGPGILN